MVLALFVPRIGMGSSAGSLVSVMIIISIVGILAAIALPAYQDFKKRAKLVDSSMESSAPMSSYNIENERNMNVSTQRPEQQNQEYTEVRGQQQTPQVSSLSPEEQRIKIKAQKALRMASELEIMIGEYVVGTGKLPATLKDIGVPEQTSTGEIRRIEITDKGFILHLQGDKEIEGKTLEFNISISEEGKVLWDCKSGSLDVAYRFGNCV